MAVGTDQSVNLGGMLGQIAETTGSMADAYKPVMQAASKPRGDMSDPAHLQRLAQWASSNGDSAAASMYMQQARAAAAEQKAAREKAEKQENMAAMNAATAQYKTALESGNQDDIAKAKEALNANAVARGYDALDRIDAVNAAVNRERDAAFQASEQKRVAEERAAQQEFSQKMLGTTDPKEIQQIVDEAPPEVARFAQQAATARFSYLANQKAWDEAVKNDAAEVSLEVNYPESLPDSVRKSLDAEHERIKDMEKAAKSGTPPTWKSLEAKRAVADAMEALNTKAFNAALDLAAAEEADRNSRLKSIDHRRTSAMLSGPDKTEREAVRETLEAEYLAAGEGTGWGGLEFNRKATDKEIEDRWLSDKLALLDQEARIVTGELTADAPKEEPKDPPAPGEAGSSEDNPVVPASKADAAKLPTGTWYRDPAGNVRQKA